MHRFTDFKPQLADSKYGQEPSLLDLIERYYIAQHVEWDGKALENPHAAAQAYIAAWLALERADRDQQLVEMHCALNKINEERIHQHEMLKTVLQQLDHLASVWGDEGVTRRCRDQLRTLIATEA